MAEIIDEPRPVWGDVDYWELRQLYRSAFDKGCKTAGIAGLVPHGLRHTAASLAISAGANVKVVQRLLGHASAAMTLDRYGHLFDDDLAEVAKSLSAAIEAAGVGIGA